MFRLIIYFITFSLSFSNEFINLTTLETQEKNNTTFVTIESLEKIGIPVKKINNNYVIKSNIGDFILNSTHIYTQHRSYTYISKPYSFKGKTYLPLDIILNLNGYTYNKLLKKGIKIKEPAPPNTYPQKIISLSPGVTEKIFALGGEEFLVGRTKYSNYPKEVEGIDTVGSMFDPNLEIILSKKPNLIIAETHFKDKLISTLNNFGINTIKFSTSSNIDDIHKSISEISILINRHMEGRVLNATLKDKIRYTQYILKTFNTPKVYYALGSGKTDITAGGDTFINSLITLSKGKNIASNKNGWKYSLEELIIEDPEIIFGSEVILKEMVKNKNYQLLSALKNNSYYIIEDDSIFNLSGPRSLTLGVYEMVKIFHPKAAPKLKIITE